MDTARQARRHVALLVLATLAGGCSGGIGSIEPATGPVDGTAAQNRQSGSAVVETSTTPERPGMSDAFVDAIGANSHFYITTDPYVTQFATIAPVVVASGIRHLRDTNQGTAYTSRMTYFAEHGIKHSVGTDVTVTAAQINTELNAFASQIDFIEPANEWDSQHATDPDWAEQLRANQAIVYKTTRANPLTKSLTVLGPSIAWPVEYGPLGNLQSEEDAGNIHNSTCDWNPGVTNYLSISAYETWAKMSTPTKPLWTTETGYGDDMSLPSCTLPDDVIAKYDPRTVSERWNAGQPRVYFYQLVDEPSDSLFGSTGLITATGKPKPQLVALQSLIGVLTDPGSAFTPTPLTYTLSGSTTNVRHTLLQRRDGTYELLLWIETAAWDHDTRSAIKVPPQTVTVTLASNAYSAKLYAYNAAWHLEPTVLTFASSKVTFAVSDSISTLEFSFTKPAFMYRQPRA